MKFFQLWDHGFGVLGPNDKKTSVKEVGDIGDKSYRSEDETFSDAVTEFSDCGINLVMEERPEGVKSLNTNVQKIDDDVKSNAIGGKHQGKWSFMFIYVEDQMVSQVCCVARM